MNQKFIHSIFLAGLLLGLLAFGSFYANATGFNNKINNDNGNVVSANQFYDMLDNTKPTEVAVKFGTPDIITTLKDAVGSKAGVVWTYKKAVTKENVKLDANFVFVAGEFKYVTLSDS